MSHCPACGSCLSGHHDLVAVDVPPMKNGSRIIEPTCSQCGRLIPVGAVFGGIGPARRVVLISGPVAAGKSTLGQYIERHYGYVFVDGDAISKRLNYRARQNGAPKCDEGLYHRETMRTVMVVLGLGYDVVAGYVFDTDEIRAYRDRLGGFGIHPLVRVLLPTREACIERDVERACWTAGVGFVDRWYAEQSAFWNLDPTVCVDTSSETVEETVALHFASYLDAPAPPGCGAGQAYARREPI